ncbi:MAG: NADH-ubiquinone oxidoreductase-F iron-sulfur binding region domain-containing protein [Phycisphaerae bacterium]|jgi:[NiFe] hydrogenase diaphorase moiety large subunit|nr:NADH-ubiquinone oxidoreductase-F iron-sulfur binding region domain-containing protein [Phycisphaerae bacterium]
MSTELTFNQIDPYEGLKTAAGMGRAEILATMQTAGMKGRGGAGFPVSIKWNLAAAAVGPEKFIVCNADEGEPGTFKDRLILSEHVDLVFDGMTIAAIAVGAQNGILYLRGEYVYLLNDLEASLAKRREDGMLGQNSAGRSGFSFDIEIRLGSGAYVCGEETALIESLEGNRGEPRNRPPFPVDTGYLGRPTVVNNVETLAWAACVLARGPEWFKGIGTEQSAGPKLLSISGDCENPGVYEFPLGVSITEILRTVGAEDARAVQIGGASGQCIPAGDFDRKIAFEDVGTGGSVIVLGPGRDMLEVARNFMEFFVEESCGQCTPCREGNEKLLEGIEMLTAGECSMKYLQELCSLGKTMQVASKCGLGQSSPNAFLSIVEHFSDEILGRTPGAVA